MCSCSANSYVSLSPVLTEIIYALEGQDDLVGVSSVCNFPSETKEKEVIGDTYFLNMEKMAKLRPDYIFSMSSNKPLLGQVNQLGIKPIYFDFNTVEDIYKNIERIAGLIDKEKEAIQLIANLKNRIEKISTKKAKKILYIAQVEPLIVAGNKSYINEIIKKSGHIPVASDINFAYPNISLEYLLKEKPDVLVILYANNVYEIKKILPKAKIVFLSKKQQDIINRPGPRFWEAIEFFANL